MTRVLGLDPGAQMRQPDRYKKMVKKTQDQLVAQEKHLRKIELKGSNSRVENSYHQQLKNQSTKDLIKMSSETLRQISNSPSSSSVNNRNIALKTGLFMGPKAGKSPTFKTEQVRIPEENDYSDTMLMHQVTRSIQNDAR